MLDAAENQLPAACPVAVGNRVVVRVDDLAFGGEGVARVQDFVVFVPFVIPGEEVEVEITEVKRSFGRGKLVAVREPSADRVKPECPYFGECGGCQYQHIAYGRQLEHKHKQVADLFERIGGFRRELVAPVIGSPRHYGYRNRIMVRSQWNKFKQGLNIGFLRHDNRLVVDIKQCPIAEPVLNEQIQHVWANPPPKGGIKVVLRVMPDDWEVPRDSFFQNNTFLLPGLVQAVRDRLKQSGIRFLVDAYCGVGFFSLELADAVERYVGIEIDTQAIKAARQNARQRGKANGEFILGRTEDYLGQVLSQMDPQATAVILDPPRTGCRPETLEMLRQTPMAQLIYVSCHPATLARDLNVLCAGGVFELGHVTPLDMFPQTQHVECVADLRYSGNRPTQA